MDALRKAEEAKRKAGTTGRPAPPASPTELRLDPLETPLAQDKDPLPSLAEELDAVEANLAPETMARSSSKRAPTLAAKAADADQRQEAERTAARNVFAVKHVARSRTSLWLFLALVGVAVVAIGGYFWWQLQSIGGGSLARPTTAARPPAIQAPPALPASTPQPPVLATVEAQHPSPTAASAEESLQPSPAPKVKESAPRARHAPSAAAGNPRPAETRLFQPGNSHQKQAQTLDRAYQAWEANRLDDARRGYEQVLKGDSRNADALLGLAAIAARQGQLERAQAFYLRVLDSDPTDVTAQAALINLRGQSGAEQSESRLKTLISRQPDSPALYFSLGNLYAGQGRWNDGQQAYFQAYSLEPGNADYIFNVAVSLDHLRQKKLAAQYYRMALLAAETSYAAFNKEAAGKRILELQP